MRSCTVVVRCEALAKDDVTNAAKPKAPLRAVPFGASSKQIVHSVGEDSVDMFSVYEEATSLPAVISGMAIFRTISSKDGIVAEAKGRISQDVKNAVLFATQDIPQGFYSYEVCVRAAGYSQTLLSGSYVVKN